jgi:RHS repeat-associated protein
MPNHQKLHSFHPSHPYPFGMMMPNRNWSSESGYRFGFNGKEQDAEGIGGNGSTYDYGFRIYNPAIAKFLSVDPLTKSYPWYSPYQFAGNSPVVFIDLDGLEEDIPSGSIATGSVITSTLTRVNDQWIDDVLERAIQTANEKPPGQGMSPGASLLLKSTLVTTFILIPKEAGGPNGELPTEFYTISNADWEKLDANISGKPIEFIGVDAEMLPEWYVEMAAERVKAGTGDFNDQNLYNEYLKRKFGGSKFIEPEVANNLRNLLGIPSDWIQESSDFGNGVRFHDPENYDNYIRVMPGDPSSEFTTRRQPYIVRRLGPYILDKNNIIIQVPKGKSPQKTEEGHIPIDDFQFSKTDYK